MQTGHGLRGIRRRIAELGGAITFEPVERGTSIAISLPLRSAARDDEPVGTAQT